MSSYKLIRPDKPTKEQDGLGLRLVAGLLALGVFWTALSFGVQTWQLLAILFSAQILASRTLRANMNDWPRNRDVFGGLQLLPERIIATTENHKTTILSTDQVRSLLLDYNHVKGKRLSFLDIWHNGLAEVTIRLEDGSEHQFKFVVERPAQAADLETFLRAMYSKGVDVNERFGTDRIRMFLLDPMRSFNEIQTLKKELGVPDISQ